MAKQSISYIENSTYYPDVKIIPKYRYFIGFSFTRKTVDISKEQTYDIGLYLTRHMDAKTLFLELLDTSCKTSVIIDRVAQTYLSL